METKVPKIFTDGMDVQLIAVKYKFISDVGEPNSKILPVDTFSLKKLYADRFVVSIKRMVSFEPKQLFYIDVESSATFYLDIKKMSGNFDSKEKMKEYLLDHLGEFVEASPVYNNISLLISQITSSFGRVPLVLPPNLIKDKK